MVVLLIHSSNEICALGHPDASLPREGEPMARLSTALIRLLNQHALSQASSDTGTEQKMFCAHELAQLSTNRESSVCCKTSSFSSWHSFY